MVFGYRNPRNPLYQLRDEMDRLLTGFFGPAADGIVPTMFRGQPAANVWEQGDALLVEMEVPGVKSDQVDISVAGGELSVKINRPEMVERTSTYHRRERPVGSADAACCGCRSRSMRIGSRPNCTTACC